MAGLAVLAIVLIGIAIYSLSQMQPQTWTSSLKSPDIQPSLRQNLPSFEYSSDGHTLKAADFTEKWTLLTFWAYWCGPCLEEMPLLNHLSEQWQGPDFDILTINVDEPRSDAAEAAHKFLSEQDIALPTLFDKEGVLKKAFSVTDLPRHYLINPEGKIVWQATGAFRWNDTHTVDQLMKIMEDTADAADSTPGPTPHSGSESAK